MTCAMPRCEYQVRYVYRVRGFKEPKYYSCWRPACVALAALSISGGDFIAVEEVDEDADD